MAQRKKTQRQTPVRTRRNGVPQQRDQQRPSPSGHGAAPGGARPELTPPKHKSDAVQTTLAHAHPPPETAQRKEGTPTRGEGAAPTEEDAENTTAQPTTTPSPPGDDASHSKGHLTGTESGRGRGYSARG